MFGEDMEKEQLGQSGRIDGVMHGDEYALLREAVHDDKDGCESGQRQKMFYEIHGDGVPQTFRDWELF